MHGRTLNTNELYSQQGPCNPLISKLHVQHDTQGEAPCREEAFVSCDYAPMRHDTLSNRFLKEFFSVWY